jgi:hypothetical protein
MYPNYLGRAGQIYKKIILTIIFLIVIAFTGTSAAADVTNNTTNITSVNHILSSNNLTNNTNTSLNNSKIIKITGNVTRCDNGKPFQGVTVTVNSVNGTFIAKTITNLQGSYILTFNGKSLNYSVTASYPGHVPSTKNVVVTLENQTQKFYGFANFRLGPMPSLTITAPSTQLLNQTFNFNLNFNNTGNMTGFGPGGSAYSSVSDTT